MRKELAVGKERMRMTCSDAAVRSASCTAVRVAVIAAGSF